jgi:hypothetical protein
LAVLGYFTLGYSMVFLLLNIIPPYVIIGYFRLYYHRVFVAIILVAVVGYSIGGY